MKKKTFKLDVQYRLAKLGMTQKEMAERLGITEAYVSFLLKGISDTQIAEVWRDKIVEILEELESERSDEVKENYYTKQ